MTPPSLSASYKTYVRAMDPRIVRLGRILLQAAAISELSETVSEPLKSRLFKRAEQSIEAVVRSLRPNPPSPLIPNAWPAPSSVALLLATELTVFANTFLQPSHMQKAVRRIATQLVEAAYEHA